MPLSPATLKVKYEKSVKLARHRKKGRQFCRPLLHHSLLIMLTLLNQGLNGEQFSLLAVIEDVRMKTNQQEYH